ncbi:MAG: 3-isopropylmalate dehydratase [Firmicutes bacterium]|jgi:3-isopropylmalate dehydratase small subunit|nr:3-isopropylmalate dehydratase [Bacillota bacterium]
MEILKGRGFMLNENVDTDQILPGFAMSYPVEELKKVTLSGSIIPDFSQKVNTGDLIIADDNFGCGSSREQAPVALKSSGVSVVVAASFARIFRRNAINIGLPVITCDYIEEIKADANDGDAFSVDVEEGVIKNIRLDKEYKLNKLSETTLDTLREGGLINKVRKILKERGAL